MDSGTCRNQGGSQPRPESPTGLSSSGATSPGPSKRSRKTALGWTFAETIPKSIWVDLPDGSDLKAFVASLASATGVRPTMPNEPESIAEAMIAPYSRGTKLLVVDGYDDEEEGIVDTMSAFLRKAKAVGGKLLVLAQESTPAYCRFYSKNDIDGGHVVERHLRGLDLEGCRAMLGKPNIDADALRRIYLLTKGCPRVLQAIREGDEASLRTHSRFTHAEIRLLLYSGGSTV